MDSTLSADPTSLLRAQLRIELDLIAAASGKSYIYENSQAVDNIFGAEYGERTLVELIQNAHDAHHQGDSGEIRIDLRVLNEQSADLYVANRGAGFNWENVQAIRNVAMSSKRVGEGIGNKGLGFRSVENLTLDPRIFSQNGTGSRTAFEGFCFRFLSAREVNHELRSRGLDSEASEVTANGVSRYLMAAPVDEQTDFVRAYARDGFASVIVLPLRTPSAVLRAQNQVRALLDSDAPIILFLDRLESIAISIDDGQETIRKQLRRRVTPITTEGVSSSLSVQRIDLSEQGAFIVARAPLEKGSLLAAVRESVDRAHVLTNWLEWDDEASVAIALPLKAGNTQGRLFNFLALQDLWWVAWRIRPGRRRRWKA